MRSLVTGDRTVDTPLPLPKPEIRKSAPAFAMRLRAVNPGEDGTRDFAVLVGRNLKIPLRSFTVTFDCPSLGKKSGGEMRCEGGDINKSQIILCKARFLEPVMPGQVRAWVSETEDADGGIRSFGPEDLEDGPAEGERPLSCSVAYDPDEEAEVRELSGSGPSRRDGKAEKSKDKPAFVRHIIAAACIVGGLAAAFALIFAAFFGYHFFMYNHLMPEVQALIAADRQDLAGEFAERYLSDNLFFDIYRKEAESTVGALMEEGRWNEALAISRSAPFPALTQETCRGGAEDALAGGRYREAYAYAAGAPEPFEDEIAAAAVKRVLEGDTDEDVWLTAQKSEASRDDLAETLAERYHAEGQYERMLAAAGLIADGDRRQKWTLLYDEWLRDKEYEHVLSLGDDRITLEYLESRAGEGENDALAEALRKKIYAAALAEEDWREAFRLARAYGYEEPRISGTGIEAEDARVRTAPDEFYFTLTPEEMRTYHRETVSASGIVAAVKNGTVTWTEAGQEKSVSGAVSVSSGPYITSILKSDGTVVCFANDACGAEETPLSAFETGFVRSAEGLRDVVAVSSGEKHTAYLHSDGTVTVLGDNSFGQASVSSWTDIIAVAAGARFTAGLRSDGTVVACGSNAAGQCEVGIYRHAVDIRACAQSLVLLFEDGTLAVAGERSMGLGAAESLENVKRIRAGLNTLIAELSDGTFVSFGAPAAGDAVDVSGWTSAAGGTADFDVGDGFVVRQDFAGELFPSGANVPKNP